MAQALAAGILIGQSHAGVLDSVAEQAKFISEELKGQARYAFRTLPDILLSGSLFLTFVLGWQPALASFAAGIISTGLAQGFLSDLLRTQSPSLARAGGALGGAFDNCSGHFPGSSWSRMASVLSHSSNLIEGVVPSYYMSVMGYMFSFVATQGMIFKDELSMRPTTAYWLRIFTIMTFIMVSGLGCIRVATNCEPWWAAIISLIFGIIFGLLFVFVIVTTFGRRIVNALHLPLLEKRIPDEKPIYVCADPNN
ncbi:MAG: hypothetical protein EBY22_07850 [Gammaproteobacteria bacterium]|nr:hypothetical protein [Gammaproteobacteria bacterium]